MWKHAPSYGRLKLTIVRGLASRVAVEKRKAAVALFLLSLLWALDGLGPGPVARICAIHHCPRWSARPSLMRCWQCWQRPMQEASSEPNGRPARPSLHGAGIGLLLFAVPTLIAAFAQGWVSQLERVAIFSLTPVFAVVLEPHLGNSAHRSNGALIAALAAVAGALCIFPLDVPGTAGTAAAVLALVAGSGMCGNRQLHCGASCYFRLSWHAGILRSFRLRLRCRRFCSRKHLY